MSAKKWCIGAYFETNCFVTLYNSLFDWFPEVQSSLPTFYWVADIRVLSFSVNFDPNQDRMISLAFPTIKDYRKMFRRKKIWTKSFYHVYLNEIYEENEIVFYFISFIQRFQRSKLVILISKCWNNFKRMIHFFLLS